MKALLGAALSAVIIYSLTACNSSSDKYVRLSAGGKAFKTIDTALGNSEGLISGSVGSSSVSSSDPISIFASGLASIWEQASAYPNPKYSGDCTDNTPGMVSIKQYMGTQFEASQKRCNGSAINIFGRLDNAFGIVCIMMNQLGTATSAESAGAADMSFTMDTATKADLSIKCPMMAADLNNETNVPTGTVVSLEFDSPAVTTTYDLKVTIQPFNNTVFLKYGGNEINFANNEDNSNGNQRVLVSYNAMTKVLRAEYVSKSKGSYHPLYVHRLFMDETNQEGRILSGIYSGYSAQNDTSSDNKESYVVSGYPNSSNIALAFEVFGMGSLTNAAYEACVNGDNGGITNDSPVVTSGSFSCGTTAATGKTTATATALSTIEAATAGSLPTTWWQLSTGSEVLNWTTRDNMLTQGL